MRLILFWVLVLATQAVLAGTDSLPPRITQVREYRQQVMADSNQQMVNIQKAAPGLVTDLRYAGTNNFTGRVLYASAPATFMRLPAARALARVQAAMAAKGYGLKVFDAYRPHAATRLMWELVKDERYAANPAKGSNHNRGLAVDLTLIDLKTGVELNMGTGFDNFTDSAHHGFAALPPAVLQNRLLLKTTMEANGFKALETEWWHYSWPNNGSYEILDISLSTMYKAVKKR